MASFQKAASKLPNAQNPHLSIKKNPLKSYNFCFSKVNVYPYFTFQRFYILP